MKVELLVVSGSWGATRQGRVGVTMERRGLGSSVEREKSGCHSRGRRRRRRLARKVKLGLWSRGRSCVSQWREEIGEVSGQGGVGRHCEGWRE